MEEEEAYEDSRNRRESVTWEIVKPMGVLKVNPSGWIKEVNLVSWNGNTPKIDIREWSQDRKRVSKGITLNDAEADELLKALSARGSAEESAGAEQKKK